MQDLRAPKHVNDYYPNAVKSSCYIKEFLEYTGATAEKVGFLTSVCSDDLNNVEMPDSEMVGPFVQGGLDGYPFAGKTGLVAFSHHIPDGGVALLFFGPHVGITSDGEVGKVIRPGQDKATSCCGAAAGALAEIDTIEPKCPSQFDPDDYQQETIRQIVLRAKNEIEAAQGPRKFIVMTEAIFRETKEAFLRLLTGIEFEQPKYVFGGIVINVDHGGESFIELRNLGKVEKGRYIDLTEEFSRKAEASFKAMQSKP